MKKTCLSRKIALYGVAIQSFCQNVSVFPEPNKNKSIVSFLSDVYTLPKQSITDLIHKEFNSSDNQFSNHVFRRFYFINRLAKTMQLFSMLEKSLSKNKINLNENTLFNFDDISFKHEKINKSINAMLQSHSMKPLFVIWNDFTRYKSIKDQLLVEEFTKEIFVISRNLILSSHLMQYEEQKKYVSDFYRNITLSPCDILDLIDTYISFFLSCNPLFIKEDTQETVQRMVDLKPFVHIDEIMERFYHIQRLHKVITILTKADACSILLKIIYSSQSTSIVLDNRLLFSNPEIISCIKVMHQTSTLKSLLKLWEDFEQYKHIQDFQFVRELSILIYFTCKELIAQTTDKKKTDFDIYPTLDMLPLEEILYAIDILAKELPPILEKFELKTDISWKEWFKKYWWAPPVVAVAIACKVLLALKIAQVFKSKAY